MPCRHARHKQVREFQPKMVALKDASKVAEFKALIKDVPQQPEILVGDEGAVEVARHPDAESVVTGIVGCAGLLPTVAAIKAKKDICLANKETLIAGGPFVLPLARQYGVSAPYRWRNAFRPPSRATGGLHRVCAGLCAFWRRAGQHPAG